MGHFKNLEIETNDCDHLEPGENSLITKLIEEALHSSESVWKKGESAEPVWLAMGNRYRGVQDPIQSEQAF